MHFVFGTLGICMVLGGMALGGRVTHFIDLASVLFVLGGTLFFTLAYLPWPDVRDAFRIARQRGPVPWADIRKPLATLATIRMIASACGILGILVGLVNMLSNLDDPASIGPAMAVALLTPMYGIIIAELIVGPAMGRLNARRCDDAQDQQPLKVSAVTLAAVPAALFAFFTMVFSLTTVIT